MVNYQLIDKKLIVSSTARQVYRGAAIFAVLFFFGFITMQVLGSIYCIPLFILPMLRPIVLLGAISIATVQAGMEIFLLLYDTSHPMKQIFWFCFLLVPPIGAALYCFLIYSRSEAIRNSANAQKSSHTAVIAN